MAEGHPLADRQQPVRCRVDRSDRRDPEPLGRAPAAAADRRPARPPRPAAEAARPRAACSSRRTKLSSIRPESACAARASRTRRPTASPSSPRGSSSNASGLPRVSAMIRSRTRSSSMNRTAEPSSARASPLRRPCTSSSDRCRELLARLARGEHDPDRLGQQAPGDEGQRQRRRLIQPLRVIDDAQQRTLLGHLREQAQAPPTRRGTDPGRRRRSARTRSPAPGAAEPEAARADRASAPHS